MGIATDAPVYAARPPLPDDEPGVVVEEGDDGLFRPDVEIRDGEPRNPDDHLLRNAKGEDEEER